MARGALSGSGCPLSITSRSGARLLHQARPLLPARQGRKQTPKPAVASSSVLRIASAAMSLCRAAAMLMRRLGAHRAQTRTTCAGSGAMCCAPGAPPAAAAAPRGRPQNSSQFRRRSLSSKGCARRSSAKAPQLRALPLVAGLRGRHRGRQQQSARRTGNTCLQQAQRMERRRCGAPPHALRAALLCCEELWGRAGQPRAVSDALRQAPRRRPAGLSRRPRCRQACRAPAAAAELASRQGPRQARRPGATRRQQRRPLSRRQRRCWRA